MKQISGAPISDFIIQNRKGIFKALLRAFMFLRERKIKSAHYQPISLRGLPFLMTLLFSVTISTVLFGQEGIVSQPGHSLELSRTSVSKARNIIFILTDDHRFDAIGFLKAQSFIKTPNLDRLAKEGAYLPNAFVTTSLCSPSRASILTGLYAHKHKVIDNQNPVPGNLVFFPQYLQKTGYQTALIGKWHMGGAHDEPQRGFDYWVSF